MAAPPIPQVGFTFPNRNLGQTPPSPGNIIAIIGACTRPDLALNEPRTLGGSADNVVSQAGYGPVGDLAANLVQGGATVVVVPADYTPATPSAVTKVGAGTSVMTVEGSPFDRYMKVIVTVTRGGTIATGAPPRIQISIDNDNSRTGNVNVLTAGGAIATIAPTTGLTLKFAAGTLVEGNTYSFTVGAPTVVAADVVTALIALRQSTEAYSMLYICGAFDRADVATIVATVATFPPKKRFVRVFLETVDGITGSEATWMSDLASDFEGYSSDLNVIAAGYEPVRSVVLGSLMWRSIGWGAAVRASLVAISRDLGARADGPQCAFGTEATGGPVITKTGVALPTGYFIHDEALVPGLNADQFMTIMSEVGLDGYYITNPNIMSGPLSDYNLLQFGRISDEVARLTNITFTQYLSGDVLLDASGLVLDKEAAKWEQGNNTALQPLVTNQNVSSLGTVVGRTANIINNEPIPVDARWQPKGYPKVFTVRVAMTRTAA